MKAEHFKALADKVREDKHAIAAREAAMQLQHLYPVLESAAKEGLYIVEYKGYLNKFAVSELQEDGFDIQTVGSHVWRIKFEFPGDMTPIKMANEVDDPHRHNLMWVGTSPTSNNPRRIKSKLASASEVMILI